MMGDAKTITASDSLTAHDKKAAASPDIAHNSRRLTEKILAAYTHAYSIGEADVACDLWEILVATDKRSDGAANGGGVGQALELAALWKAFVDARNAYYTLSELAEPDADRSATAFEAMKAAYLDWARHGGCA